MAAIVVQSILINAEDLRSAKFSRNAQGIPFVNLVYRSGDDAEFSGTDAETFQAQLREISGVLVPFGTVGTHA